MNWIGKHIVWLLGLALVVLGVLSAAGDVFSAHSLKVIILVSGVVQALAGFIKLNPPDSITTVAKMLPLLLLTTMMSACSFMQKLSTPAAQPYVTAAVLVGVATAEQKGVSAVQINSICKQALAADSGTAASLQAIGDVINQQLKKLNLPEGDLAAIQLVEAGIGATIQQSIGQNANVAQFQATVAMFLNAAIQATGG